MSLSLPTETQVLIVGAGPNGMACAVALNRVGLQVTIVEAQPERKYGPRASLIHPRTLEELDTIGLAKPLLNLGIHSTGVTFHSGTETLIAVDVSKLDKDTLFPTTVLISQDDVESIFEERLTAEKVPIVRNKKVVGIKEASDARGAEVSFEDDTKIVAQYVIGADGSRSTIREIAGIDFKDPDTGVPYDVNAFPVTALQIVLADVYFEEPLAPILRDAVSWHLNGRMLFCPLPRSDKYPPTSDMPPTSFWRIAIVIPIGTTPPPRHPDQQYMQSEVDKRNPFKQRLHIVKLTRAATYRVRSAVAGTFFNKIGAGNILLVGDAAHVHSPAGAQGINLGLCDALALGRTIHRHANGVKDGVEGVDDLLVKYSTSRQQTAIHVIRMVKKLTAAINAVGWRITARNVIMWIAGCVPFVRTLAAWRLSGLVHRDV